MRILRLAPAIVGAIIIGAVGIAPAAADSVTSLFGDAKPDVGSWSDSSAVTVGVRVEVKDPGAVTGIRFYEGDSTRGPFEGGLFSSSGQLLARVTVPNQRGAGWREAAFPSSVQVREGQTVVAAVFMPSGRYAGTSDFDWPAETDSLKGVTGTYRYGSDLAFPSSSYGRTNYFVDLSFTPSGSTPTTSPSSSPSASATPTRSPSSSPSASATPTRSPTSSPSATSASPTSPAQAPPAGECVGAANTPGGADPWGGCWPGPQNTGYPRGLPGDTRKPVNLTTYTGPTTIRSCGVVIDSKIVNSTILVQAGNGTKSKNTPCVTIRNSLVRGVIFSEQSNFGPVLVEDTEVSPPDLPWWENIGRNNVFVYRVNSNGGEGVIKCESNCEAKDNWVHGMQLGGAYHYNAFGGNGTDGFVIDHNYASCGDWVSVASPTGDAGCSAVIGFYGDFGPIRNITINRNYLVSAFDMSASGQYRQAGYCLNPGYYPGKPYPAPSNVSVTGNIFGRGASGKCGVYGPTNSLNARGATNGNVWSDNRFSDGTPIARSEE